MTNMPEGAVCALFVTQVDFADVFSFCTCLRCGIETQMAVVRGFCWFLGVFCGDKKSTQHLLCGRKIAFRA